ncbi:serine/threonine protein kinase [Roseococcus sp. SYP-B2431]|uniref:serine/threonine-protein kinase n=1 Tax=Roseococcus sp. SYP-B2431 TaxID=2496640 RepID=UPI00103DEC69|nr:serine/threonine-protein kinase [Roseococcus sp. SYP-B2431]TCH99463.1 serine/threonine protein kinase [Roseococcus sp. SYP-B2431]
MTGGTAPPARFGRYLAVEELGAGAMGRVYRAHDPLIDRTVAVKTIRADLLEPEDRPEFLERFRTEVRAAGRCAHPAIVGVYDFADDADPPYIVMEFVQGRALSAILRELRGNPSGRGAALPTLTRAMLQVLDGLGAAHALGVVHRDIKPGNIMVTPQGLPKIADFGIARLGLSALTAAGGVVGTPSYMAPEQAMGHPVDHRIDLFAVAAMLYEIQLGRPPFAAPSLAETLLRLTAPEPAELGVLAGTTLGAVLARGLAKDRDFRFASAADFAGALGTALADGVLPDEATRVLAPTAPPLAVFDPGLIDRLRVDLASRLGPLAVTLLRRAVATSASEEELLRACSAMIESAEERMAFLRLHAAAPAPPPPPAAATATAARTSPPTSIPTRSSASAAAPGFELSPATRAAAVQALAYVVGPLAKILVQKAAAQAATAPEFVGLLCAHATPAEAPALRRELEALF